MDYAEPPVPTASWMAGADPDVASSARVYDYYLGGSHYFPVDRQVGDKAAAAFPDLPMALRANRSFLRRAVRFLIDQGITQFLDLGSGIPTVGNVHEIAQSLNPEARVVYVDIDPVAVAHSRALLAGNDNADVVLADIRDPETVLNAPAIEEMLDLSEPVGLLIVALLHFLPEKDEPAALIGQYVRSLAPGSYLVLSHGTPRTDALRAQQAAADEYARGRMPVYHRTPAQITAMFDGLDIVDPGLVYTGAWRPDGQHDEFDGEPSRSGILAGVGYLPRA